jgi:arabinogalactan endo-1,4-beta-galactosidase
MVYGEQKINNQWYYFNTLNGAMVRGFFSFPGFGKSVYYNNNGQMVHGWVNVGGTNYHFSEADGRILGFNQRVVDWFRNRKGRLTYSMYGSRNGADGTADCSGSMTQAIRDAGGTPYSYLYNTESLHDYLANNGYHLVSEGYGRQNVQYGDVIIWGRRGYSAGEGGHTLVISSFGNNPESISTSYWTQGQRGTAVSELPYYQYWADDNYPYQYVYRQWNQGRA